MSKAFGIAVAATVSLCALAAGRQPDPRSAAKGIEYTAVLATYMRKPAEAAATIATWTDDDVERGVRQLPAAVGAALADGDRARLLLQRMALLHTQAVFAAHRSDSDAAHRPDSNTARRLDSDAARRLDSNAARVHAQWARRIMYSDLPWEPALRPPPLADEAPAFYTDWALALAGIYQNALAFDTGRAFLDEELQRHPHAAPLAFARGTLEETAASDRARPPDATTRVSRLSPVRVRAQPTQAERRRRAALEAAARFYERALSDDESLDEARLRLGRVRFALEADGDALRTLNEVMARRPRQDIAYLANLFLAAVHERAGHSGEATRAFEAAAELYPAAQAPQLGLSRLSATTDPAAAADILRRMFSTPPQRPPTGLADPWWAYDAGVGATVAARLEFLRRQVSGG